MTFDEIVDGLVSTDRRQQLHAARELAPWIRVRARGRVPAHRFEDFVAEINLGIWRNRFKVAAASHREKYAARMIKNGSVDLWRKEKRETLVAPDELPERPVELDEAPSASDARKALLRKLLAEVVAYVKPPHNQDYALYFQRFWERRFEEKTLEQILGVATLDKTTRDTHLQQQCRLRKQMIAASLRLLERKALDEDEQEIRESALALMRLAAVSKKRHKP